MHWQHCLPVPEGMMLADAAALPETLFTVWHNLFRARGSARDGETVLVHGGTSGIGTMAIMLAKAFGMGVIVTCGAAAKMRCRHPHRRGPGDQLPRGRFRRGGDGPYGRQGRPCGCSTWCRAIMWPRNLKCLAEDGRHVTIAVLGGAKADINMAVVMMKRLTLTGSTLRPRTDRFKAALAGTRSPTMPGRCSPRANCPR